MLYSLTHLGASLLANADGAATAAAAVAHSSVHQLLPDIGVAVLAATLLGLIAHWTKQPGILGLLVAGALVGPKVGFGLIHGQESVEVISEMGLILLLFIIGLEMNLKALLSSGRQLLVGGFGQFPLCALIGVGLFWGLMGYGLTGNNSDGLYLALMCALSSTAVVVKLLYDKGELDTLPGRTTLGILVVQDVFAIFVLAFQPNFANPTIGPVFKALGGTVLLLLAGFLISKHVLGRIFASVAKSPEMVMTVSIGWCALVAGVAGWMGLSKEMGALVAGLCIAAFPYSIHVTAKTLPLRDFFLTLFFVSLGMKISAPTWGMVPVIAVMIAFTIASRFLTIYPLLIASGGGRRTAFISSLNLSQISEFSLVIGGIGLSLGHIRGSTIDVAIYAMAIMAVMSSYLIRYNHQLYVAFDKLMAKLGRGSTAQNAGEAAAAGKHDQPVVLLGFHRTGRALVDVASRTSPALLSQIRVIDFNPEVLAELKERGVAGMFGDISSLDTLEHAHLHHAKLVLCTIPDMLLKGTDNQTLVKTVRAVAPHARIAATADDAKHAELLREEGADVALNHHELAAEQLITLVAGLAGEPTRAAHEHRGGPEPVSATMYAA
jgi:Kef-type K+ transport system membrane component KefB